MLHFLAQFQKSTKKKKKHQCFSFLPAQMFVLVITMYENGSFHFNSLGGHGAKVSLYLKGGCVIVADLFPFFVCLT